MSESFDRNSDSAAEARPAAESQPAARLEPAAIAPAPSRGSGKSGRTRGCLLWLAMLGLAALIALGLSAAAALAGLDYIASRPGEAQGRECKIDIPRGASLQIIAETLEAEGLVPSRHIFMAYVFRQGLARHLQAGRYQLNTSMSLSTIANALRHGRFEIRATIPEGFTVRQIAERLAARGLIPSAEEFIELAADPAMLALAGLAEGTVEGYLFPDTYSFESEQSARAFMERMIREFNRQADKALADPAAPPPYSRRDWVILASMIEREARNTGEMARIASVYYNRLREGMNGAAR